MSPFKLVEKFNIAVVGIGDREIGPIQDQDEFNWLVGALKEEIGELIEANGQDFIAEIDSLIDLVYFALGGLTRMGIPAELAAKIFEAVHNANMAKVAGKKAREVQHALDAVKPETWVDPAETIANLIEEYKQEQIEASRKTKRAFGSKVM